MSISDFLASLVSPKTLESAKGQVSESKAKLTAINAMFDAAGLKLDDLLAAGPDSLKAHIDSFKGADEQLAAANAAIAQHAEEIAALNESLAEASNEAQELGAALASIGYVAADGDDVKQSFSDYVKKQAALELARVGHPPVAQVAPDAAPPAQKSDKEHYLAYAAMPEGAEKRAYFAKHGDQIWAGKNAK